ELERCTPGRRAEIRGWPGSSSCHRRNGPVRIPCPYHAPRRQRTPFGDRREDGISRALDRIVRHAAKLSLPAKVERAQILHVREGGYEQVDFGARRRAIAACRNARAG